MIGINPIGNLNGQLNISVGHVLNQIMWITLSFLSNPVINGMMDGMIVNFILFSLFQSVECSECTHTTDSISFSFLQKLCNAHATKTNIVRGGFKADGFVCNS